MRLTSGRARSLSGREAHGRGRRQLRRALDAARRFAPLRAGTMISHDFTMVSWAL